MLLVSEGNSISFSFFNEVLRQSHADENILAMMFNGARGETETATAGSLYSQEN